MSADKDKDKDVHLVPVELTERLQRAEERNTEALERIAELETRFKELTEALIQAGVLKRVTE
jgi:hypothetical protein